MYSQDGLCFQLITLVLLNIGRIFYSDFGLFYQIPMNSGALFDVTNTIDTYVYRSLLQLGNIGMASAAGFYQSLVGFTLILICNFIVRKIENHAGGAENERKGREAGLPCRSTAALEAMFCVIIKKS